jgi:predicted DNA-binding transcriptional regulator AlpA
MKMNTKKSPFDPDERLLKMSEVCAWLGIAMSSLHNWINAGHFPKPIVLGDPNNPHSAVRFRKSEVDEWINARPREKSTTDIFGAQARGEGNKDYPDSDEGDA